MNELLKYDIDVIYEPKLIHNSDGTITFNREEVKHFRIHLNPSFSYLDNFYMLRKTFKYIREEYNLNAVNFVLCDLTNFKDKFKDVERKMYLERKKYIERKLRERALKRKLVIKEVNKGRKKI